MIKLQILILDIQLALFQIVGDVTQQSMLIAILFS